MEFYYDDEGYPRFTDTNKLVHRWAAHKYIFKKNKDKFSKPFRDLVVHHKDRSKLHFHSDNLVIMTKSEHESEHGINEVNVLNLTF